MTKRSVVSAILLVTAVAITAFVFYRPPPEQHDHQWATLRTRLGTLEDTTVAIGAIKPAVGGQVKVGSQISGVVDQLKVSAGDMVEQGDILAILNTAQIRARIDAIKQDLALAKAEHAFAVTQLSRYTQAMEISRNQIDGFRRDVEVRKAMALRSEAELRQARIELGYATIRAPISGMIESVGTYQGETVAASFSAPTFVTIVDLHRLQIECNVDESNIGRIHIGQEVSFSVDAYPSRTQKGVVRAILPKAVLVNSVVNYIVIVETIDKDALVLRPEMTVRVNFVLQSKNDIITVPRSAIIREGGRSYVLVQKGDNWHKEKVRTGSSTSQRVEISSGLGADETVLVDAQLWIREFGDRAYD